MAHPPRAHRSTILILTPLLVAALTFGCEGDTSGDRDRTRRAPVIVAGEGVGCVRIGAREEDVREGCGTVSDTVLHLEGMEQPAVRVRVGGTDLLAEIVDGRVWRVSVLGPAPRTPDSLGVGTPYASAAEVLDLEVHPGEGRFFAVPAGVCGISFELEGVPFETTSPHTDALRAAGDAVRISRVLIYACGGG